MSDVSLACTNSANAVFYILGMGVFFQFTFAALSLLFTLTIIGIPYSVLLWEAGKLCASPYSYDVVQDEYLHANSIKNCLTIIVGLPLAAALLTWAALWTLTIVGIPFASAYVKIAMFIIAPFGKRLVEKQNKDTSEPTVSANAGQPIQGGQPPGGQSEIVEATKVNTDVVPVAEVVIKEEV